MNKKGFTTIELIITFALTIMIMGFLFELVLGFCDLYLSSGFKTELIQKQATLSRRINREFNSKTVSEISSCGNGCLTFSFTDGSSSDLIIDKEQNTFEYSGYKTQLVTNSSFGNNDIEFYYEGNGSSGKENAILNIKIPIYHSLYPDENFGLNIIYQFDNNVNPLSPISF